MEKIAEFKKENKELSELNKTSQMDLKSLQTSMTETQNDVEKLKEDYKILQLTNKELLLELQDTNKLKTSNDVDHAKELQTKNEDNFSSSEGLLVISD